MVEAAAAGYRAALGARAGGADGVGRGGVCCGRGVWGQWGLVEEDVMEWEWEWGRGRRWR